MKQFSESQGEERGSLEPLSTLTSNQLYMGVQKHESLSDSKSGFKIKKREMK